MERREQYCSGESPEQASSKGPEKGLSSEEGALGRSSRQKSRSKGGAAILVVRDELAEMQALLGR
jgi:hypothetical protein